MPSAPALRSEVYTPRVLTPEEDADFARLESKIEPLIGAMIEAATLLRDVKRSKYFLKSHSSWEEYLEKRWNVGRAYGNRLIQFADVRDDMASHGLPSPSNESQVRRLSTLPPETRREAWEEATRETPTPTARQIEAAVAKVAPAAAKTKPPRAPKSDDMAAHVAFAKESGIAAPGAEVYIDEAGGDPAAPIGAADEREDDDAPEPSAELSDEDWLATLPARVNLAPHSRAWFDAEALAFRQVTALRLKFVRACKPITNAAKRAGRGHIGPWLDRHFYYLRMNGPERWLACEECKGTGQEPLIGKCAACRGHGYHV